MPTTTSFKNLIDIPLWRPEAPTLAVNAAGQCLANDKSNSSARIPHIFLLRSATALDAYNPIFGDWIALASPALGGTFAAGTACIFHSSAGPRGTIAAGATTTTITLTTALPASVGINALANKGDGIGFMIRIIGSAAGSSGKVEERFIVANTAGTTPTITLNSALSFTPATGDAYEIHSGRLFMLNSSTVGAGSWKYYDVATNSYSGNLATTNLPATITTDSAMVALSESYTPVSRTDGEGFISGGATSDGRNCIQGTAATSTTITGSGMPSTLFTNEYRNFQVRIVEDTVTPTSVGQRRRIASHTSGATGVFTVTAFAVTPSSSAKFVVENDNDKIILRTSGAGTVYNYNITANTWDSTTWIAAANANGAGCVFEQSFGIDRDVTGNARHSYLYFIRGGGSVAIDVLDIAGAATGSWSAAVVYKNAAQTFTSGTSGAYEFGSAEGKYLHLNINGTQRTARFDMKNRVLESGPYLRYPQGVATIGNKMAVGLFVDGATKLSLLYHQTNTQAQFYSFINQG